MCFVWAFQFSGWPSRWREPFSRILPVTKFNGFWIEKWMHFNAKNPNGPARRKRFHKMSTISNRRHSNSLKNIASERVFRWSCTWLCDWKHFINTLFIHECVFHSTAKENYHWVRSRREFVIDLHPTLHQVHFDGGEWDGWSRVLDEMTHKNVTEIN